MKTTARKKILITDDSESSLLFLKKLLETLYDIKVATNGKEFYELLPVFKPDLILLDIMMPDISGFAILEDIKKKEEFKETPVLIISAKVESKDIKKALELGASDYIMKPLIITDLLSRIEKHMNI